MKLSQLLSIYSHLKWGSNPHREISGICSDSRALKPNDVFVAVVGAQFDGHNFVPEACQRGVPAVVVQKATGIPVDYTGAVVVVEDSRIALGTLASRFFESPSEELFCVGVTGTNGKTTVTHMVEAILTQYGWSTGVMGTIDHHIGSRHWQTDLTTPDAISFQRRVSEFRSLGAKAMAVEVSSHALDQQRMEGTSFDAVVFTNLSQDHFDYHKTMENYFHAKARLFHEVLGRSRKQHLSAIINQDDPYGRRLINNSLGKVITYGQRGDIVFQIKHQDFQGTLFEIITPSGRGELILPMFGLHNVYNAAAAIGVGMVAGVSLTTCIAALEKFSGVRGRLQPVNNELGIHIFVDYAHSDGALKSVLSALNEVRKQKAGGGKIITVFGCAGDRDKDKRPLMGKVAAENSDVVFVTNDNSRSEDPQIIAEQVVAGIEGAPQSLENIFIELDRRTAIERALRLAQAGDIVLIAGKGHEESQTIGDKKIYFSDGAVTKEILECLGKSESTRS